MNIISIIYLIRICKNISLILFLIFGLKIKSVDRKNNNGIKICLCTLGKDENRYPREFVEYYKKLEVDKIFIYDNKDISGEKFDYVLLY